MVKNNNFKTSSLRKRSTIVAFRMEEDRAKKLDALVSLSGLTKQDYIERKLLDEAVSVIPSSRIAKSLSYWMQSIYQELLLARQDDRVLDADIIWITRTVAEEYGALASPAPILDANSAMKSMKRR